MTASIGCLCEVMYELCSSLEVVQRFASLLGFFHATLEFLKACFHGAQKLLKFGLLLGRVRAAVEFMLDDVRADFFTCALKCD